MSETAEKYGNPSGMSEGKQMTAVAALEILIQHNKWRQGLTSEMPYTPGQLTAALDVAIAELSPKTAVHKPDAIGQSEQLCRTFFSDGKTTSATRCQFCGKEKWAH